MATATSGDASDSDADSDSEDDDDEDDGDESGGDGACRPGDGPSTVALGDEVAGADAWVSALAFVGDTAVACGDGFVGVPGGTSLSLDLDGTCVGIAEAGSGQAVVATSSELVLVVVSGGGVEELARTALPERAFGVAADDAGAVAVAASTGLLAFDASGGSLGANGSLSGPTAPRGVAWAGDGWLVADDEAGVALVGADGGVVSSLPEITGGLGVVVDGGVGIILRGGYGFDVVSVAGDLQARTNVPTEGTAVAAAVRDGVALVVTGAALHRYEVGDGAKLSGRVVRPDYGALDGGWFRAVALGDGEALVSIDDSIHEVTVESDAEAGVLLMDRVTTTLYADAGPGELIVLMRNAGNATLRVGNFDVAAPFEVRAVEGGEESDDCDDHLTLGPDGTALVTIGGDLSGDAEIITFTAETSDPNWPQLEVDIDVNRPTVDTGTAFDFTGLTLDGEPFRLSAHRGEVVFLKLFAPS